MMYLSTVRAKTRNFLGKFVKSERGVTAIEYAIVAAGVAVVVMVIFKGDGPVANMLSNTFSTLKDKMADIIGEVGK
ncbi:MAG: Flp family type IVb pilin [Gilliamella sp.]|uniref:Flp family type IVb pilin n=1 Tax=Gilliamella sp. TaxID=1891236 RepID=UPI00260006AB|nr:Flp family type IVb pilin [Gilliamella sp.]MCO6544846.1 Flp family type IVb pilin [Gilliamella sp.]MCO6547287.1 Flp family type IVb pilin [Gilliamella sp.]